MAIDKQFLDAIRFTANDVNHVLLQRLCLTIAHLFEAVAYCYERLIDMTLDASILVKGILTRTANHLVHVTFGVRYLATHDLHVATCLLLPF